MRGNTWWKRARPVVRPAATEAGRGTALPCARVRRAAAGDPGLQRFGAQDHAHRLRPCLAEHEIRGYELEYGVRLPESCRSFLTDVADGGAGPYSGLYRLADRLDEERAAHDERAEGRRPGFLATPFPRLRAFDGPGKNGSQDYSVSGTLVVAEAGRGMYLRLVVTGECAGQVWLDDRDWGGLSPGPDFYDWYTAWLESTA